MNQHLLLSPIPLPDLLGEISKAVRSELDARSLAPAPPAEELLSRTEAAKLLGITLPTLRDWTRKGHVTGYRIGSRIRYKRNEVLNGLASIVHRKTSRP